MNMVRRVPDYEPEIKQFTDAMRYKLKVNAHKGKWEDKTPEQLLDLLRREVDELEQAVREGNQVEMILEAGDVGNFAMMLVNVAMKYGTGAALVPEKNTVVRGPAPEIVEGILSKHTYA